MAPSGKWLPSASVSPRLNQPDADERSKCWVMLHFHPTLLAVNLTSEERTAYAYLFVKADTEQIGVLVGEKAVAFVGFERTSSLPPSADRDGLP